MAVLQQWERPQLTPKERAILSMAATVANQTLGAPFKYFVHVATRRLHAVPDYSGTVRSRPTSGAFEISLNRTKAARALG